MSYGAHGGHGYGNQKRSNRSILKYRDSYRKVNIAVTPSVLAEGRERYERYAKKGLETMPNTIAILEHDGKKVALGIDDLREARKSYVKDKKLRLTPNRLEATKQFNDGKISETTWRARMKQADKADGKSYITKAVRYIRIRDEVDYPSAVKIAEAEIHSEKDFEQLKSSMKGASALHFGNRG